MDVSPKLRWIFLLIATACILAVLTLWWTQSTRNSQQAEERQKASESENQETEKPAVSTQIPPPAGSRVVEIEINIDDTSHAIIESGDKMDVVELTPAADTSYRTLVTDALISKVDYSVSHPLIYIILKNEMADVVESKLFDGKIRLHHSIQITN